MKRLKTRNAYPQSGTQFCVKVTRENTHSQQILAGQKKKSFTALQYTAMITDNQGETFTPPDSTGEDMNRCCI